MQVKLDAGVDDRAVVGIRECGETTYRCDVSNDRAELQVARDGHCGRDMKLHHRGQSGEVLRTRSRIKWYNSKDAVAVATAAKARTYA